MDKKKERNGKVFISGWVDKEAEKKFREKAKKNSHTITAALQIALYEYISR